MRPPASSDAPVARPAHPTGAAGSTDDLREPAFARRARAMMLAPRCRSFAFLDRQGESWTVFLMTYPDAEGNWRGYFTFRRGDSAPENDDVRTADLFVEATEAELDERARGLGRPLLLALLESARHTYERRRGFPDTMREWFGDVLKRRSAELVADIRPNTELTLAHLQSLYASYRVDQVAHLTALIGPDAFSALVEQLLAGREIDFRARDRLQLAMTVVQELERLLPLPPFEVWVEDYVANPEAYRVYSHALHRGEGLP